jgi:hypothetical protein
MDSASITLIDVILFLIFVLVIVWIVYFFSRKKKGEEKPPPVIYIIQASDAPEHTGRLREILQNLKSENRISRFTVLSADEELSTLPGKLKKEDMILIVLTRQLEDHKNRIETRFNSLKDKQNGAKAAELLVDNVVYDKAFITLPPDLIPMRNRKDMDDAWSSTMERLKMMFPKMKGQVQEKQPENDRFREVEKQSGNDRLKAVKDHPDYPELLNKIRPGSAFFFERYLFQIILVLGLTFIAVYGAVLIWGNVIFLIFLLIFTVVGIGTTGYGIYRIIKRITSNTYKLPALIVDKRISVGGDGQSSPSGTTYYVTLELDDLGRQELKAKEKLYGKITKEDAGVACIHDRYLLNFKRLAL